MKIKELVIAILGVFLYLFAVCLFLFRFGLWLALLVLWLADWSKSTKWVISDRVEWGISSWCYRQEVYENLKQNNISQCYDIQPREGPAYCYSAGLLAAVSFLLIFIFSNFGLAWFDKERYSCSRGTACLVSFLCEVVPSSCLAGSLGLLSTHYKDDYRWKNANPSLGEAFWTLTYVFVSYVLVCFGTQIVVVCGNWKSIKNALRGCCTFNCERIHNALRGCCTINCERIHNALRGCCTINWEGTRDALRGCCTIAWERIHNTLRGCCTINWERIQNALRCCNLCRPRQRPPTKHTAKDVSTSNHSKKIAILRTMLIRAFKTSMQHSRSGTTDPPPVNSLSYQHEHQGSLSSPTIRESLDAPTADQSGRPEDVNTSEHSPVNAGQNEGAACYNMDNDDCPCIVRVQQDGQEPFNNHADMDSPGAPCISQPQRRLIDVSFITDRQTGRLVFQLQRPEELSMDDSVTVHI